MILSYLNIDIVLYMNSIRCIIVIISLIFIFEPIAYYFVVTTFSFFMSIGLRATSLSFDAFITQCGCIGLCCLYHDYLVMTYVLLSN